MYLNKFRKDWIMDLKAKISDIVLRSDEILMNVYFKLMFF